MIISREDYYEYHESKAELMEGRSSIDREEEEARENDEKFEEEVNRAYDILWEMWSPGSHIKREGDCNWDGEKEEKLKNMLTAIDRELGR